MNRSTAVTLSVALLAGLAMPVVLAIAYAEAAQYVDPGARFAFFLGAPRHPVRLALLAWSMHLAGAVALACTAVYVSRRRPINVWWPTIAFATGYAIFLVLGLPRGGVGHASWLAIAKLAALPVGLAACVALFELRKVSWLRVRPSAA